MPYRDPYLEELEERSGRAIGVALTLLLAFFIFCTVVAGLKG